MDAAKKAVAKKSSSEYVGKRDAGAIAAKKMRDKEQQKYVGFLPANEGYKGTMDMSKSHPEALKKVEDNIAKQFGKPKKKKVEE